MSWKLRRASYYSSQRGSNLSDSETAKCINFWFLVAILLTFLAIALTPLSSDNLFILFIRAIAGLGFLSTPFLLVFALIGKTFQYGLPESLERWLKEKFQKNK